MICCVDLELSIYRDKERSLKHADITRTELQLKKVYDELVPQARWSSGDVSEISRATKPESGDWIEQPVVKALLQCAKDGVALGGKGIVMDAAPECRAATAMIQAGVSEIIICNLKTDARWAVPLEVERARDMLLNDAKVKITETDDAEKALSESRVAEFLNASSLNLKSKKRMQN